MSNQGVSGEKAAESAKSIFLRDEHRSVPTWCCCSHGHNDIPSGADGAASTAANEVRVMAIEAKLRGARVFIATPVPAAS